MKKTKLKIIVKMRKRDNFKYNYDVDYNDDEYEDIGKVKPGVHAKDLSRS